MIVELKNIMSYVSVLPLKDTEHLIYPNLEIKKFITDYLELNPNALVAIENDSNSLARTVQLIEYLNPYNDLEDKRFPIAIKFEESKGKYKVFFVPMFVFNWKYNGTEPSDSNDLKLNKVIREYNSDTKKIIDLELGKCSKNLLKFLNLSTRVKKIEKEEIEKLMMDGFFTKDGDEYYNFSSPNIASKAFITIKTFESGEIYSTILRKDTLIGFMANEDYINLIAKENSIPNKENFLEQNPLSKINIFGSMFTPLLTNNIFDIDISFTIGNNVISIKKYDITINGNTEHYLFVYKLTDDYSLLCEILDKINNYLIEKYK